MIQDIPDEITFKIYVSALTTISIDSHNWIPTTDTRLLRRIIRDYRFRNTRLAKQLPAGQCTKRRRKMDFPFSGKC
jgi:uridine kinase